MIHTEIEMGNFAGIRACINAGELHTRDSLLRTPLHAAAIYQSGGRPKEITQLLLDDGGWTPLHTWAAVGSAWGTGLLIAHGADDEAADHAGDTPLCKSLEALAAALQDGNLKRAAPCEEVVGVLLDAGAATDRCHPRAAALYRDVPKPNWRDRGEMLLLPLRRRVLTTLLGKGLQAGRSCDDRGNTLLHVLCRCAAPSDDILLLLEAGVADSINLRTADGDVPLLLYLESAKRPAMQTVRALLEHGADATMVNGQGRTAVEITDTIPRSSDSLALLVVEHGCHDPYADLRESWLP